MNYGSFTALLLRFERMFAIIDSVVILLFGRYFMIYDSNNHSVFLLQYHLIMCVKYRRKIINDEISSRLREIFVRIALGYNITLDEWNHDRDHIHVLFRGQPDSEISRFINTYKSASSRLIKIEYPAIRESLWKEMFWSRSFCLLTTGGATVDIIRQYIESQGEDSVVHKRKHHAAESHQVPGIPQ